MKFSPVFLGALFGSVAAAVLFGAGWVPSGVNAASVSGEAVYKEYCASCHDHPGPRIPPRSALQKLSVARILHTLDFGVMMSVAYPLQRSQREAVAQFLGKPGTESGPPPSAFCSDRRFSFQRDSMPELGRMESFCIECAFPIRGVGRS